jgi:hypothetical protein
MGKLRSSELVYSAFCSLYLKAYPVILASIILFIHVLKGKVIRHSIGSIASTIEE